MVLAQSKVKQKSVLIDNISDYKELKKLFRTKNNVLVLFTSNPTKEVQNTVKALDEAAQTVKGEATAVHIDCSLRYLINIEGYVMHFIYFFQIIHHNFLVEKRKSCVKK